MSSDANLEQGGEGYEDGPDNVDARLDGRAGESSTGGQSDAGGIDADATNSGEQYDAAEASVGCKAGNGTACGGTGSNMVCESGVCQCASGYQSCSGTCMNVLGTDSSNCGACGRSCRQGTCASGVCQPWVVTATNGFAGSQHVIATDGTNIVWLDASNNAEQVPIGGGATTNLGPWNTDYAVGSIAVAGGVVAWTAFPNPSLLGMSSEPSQGGFYTAIESSANSVIGLVASDSNANFYGFGGIGLRANGGTGYTLLNGGMASLISCSLSGFAGSCSNFGPYSGGEAVDDLILSGSTLYWTEFGGMSVFSMSTSGGAVTTIASGETGPVLVAADSSNVYWANNNSSGAYNMDKNPQSNPNPTAASNVLPFTIGTMTCLATDGKYVYFSGSVGTMEVGYVPVGGASSPTQLAALQSGGGSVAAPSVLYWNGVVYWADQNAKAIRAIAAPL